MAEITTYYLGERNPEATWAIVIVALLLLVLSVKAGWLGFLTTLAAIILGGVAAIAMYFYADPSCSWSKDYFFDVIQGEQCD